MGMGTSVKLKYHLRYMRYIPFMMLYREAA